MYLISNEILEFGKVSIRYNKGLIKSEDTEERQWKEK